MRAQLLLALVLVSCCLSAQAAAPQAAPVADVTTLVRMIIGLAVVVAAIIGLAWFLRRVGGVTGQRLGDQLQVIGGLTVGQRERVVLLQVGEQQLLLGVAPGRVQTLHVLEQPLEQPTTARGAKRSTDGAFADRLRRVMQQQDERR